jgi:hypothetical protein
MVKCIALASFPAHAGLKQIFPDAGFVLHTLQASYVILHKLAEMFDIERIAEKRKTRSFTMLKDIGIVI